MSESHDGAAQAVAHVTGASPAHEPDAGRRDRQEERHQPQNGQARRRASAPRRLRPPRRPRNWSASAPTTVLMVFSGTSESWRATATPMPVTTTAATPCAGHGGQSQPTLAGPEADHDDTTSVLQEHSFEGNGKGHPIAAGPALVSSSAVPSPSPGRSCPRRGGPCARWPAGWPCAARTVPAPGDSAPTTTRRVAMGT